MLVDFDPRARRWHPPRVRSHLNQLSFLLAIGVATAALLACDKPTSPGETPDDAGSADPTICAGHKEGDPCVDAEAFAACKEAEAECPGEVVTMESCPLQFACG